jgi:hypothetical protein
MFQLKRCSTMMAVTATPAISMTALTIWRKVAPGIPPSATYSTIRVPMSATHMVRVVALGSPMNWVNKAMLPTSWATM